MVNYWITTPPNNQKGKQIVVPIYWPQEFIHRAGQADASFDKMSLAELVCGTLRIVINTSIPPEERVARLTHLIDLTVMAEHYRWDRVRSLYEEVLSSIQQGRRPWSAGIKDLKDEMLSPADQIFRGGRPNKGNPLGNPQIQTCRLWNWGKEGCSRGETCIYKHACSECAKKGQLASSHTGKDCNKDHKVTSA